MSLNNIAIMGRLVKDPELRRTQAGDAVASFTLAVERDAKNREGVRETDFLDCVAWRSTAEFAARYFQKGSCAIVKGRLAIRKYETKDGQKRSAPEIITETLYFADSKKDADSDGNTRMDKLVGAEYDAIASGFAPIAGNDSDLPF